MNQYEQEHLNMLRPYLAECTVLLRRNSDFPLESPTKIAAFGNGVRETIRGGTGSGEVNCRHIVSVEEGLEQAGFTITTKAWLAQYEQERIRAKKTFIQTIKKRATILFEWVTAV